ncbi:hypothetical protein HZA87_05825 [Candidatus Uhrbacteria bacterium]|nr:hypothetical protein [Candidatus Uhrbacteria bacterium]
MQSSFLMLALVAALIRPALAHDCPCECPKVDSGDQPPEVVEQGPFWAA